MPTYNYRLTGRDPRSLSPVETSDRVLLWGSDGICCGHPGCKFEICAVGGENVLGGAMQEGWGFSQHLRDVAQAEMEALKADKSKPAIGIGMTADEFRQKSPFRCALHRNTHLNLTDDEFADITPEWITQECPGPKHPEYQRGHADGFEQGMEAAKRVPAMGGPFGGPMMPTRTGMDLPSADEIMRSVASHGGIQSLSGLFAQASTSFMSGGACDPNAMMAGLGEQMGVPPIVAKSVFVMGVLCSSLYFNDKYAAQIEAALEASRPVQ